MTLLESLIYGVVSGASEFFPISMQAHQALTMQIFGISQREPLRDLLVHMAMILALFAACASSISRLRRDRKLITSVGRKRNRVYDTRGLYEYRLLKSAALPMLAGMLLYFATDKWESSLVYMALFLLVNGIILIVPEHIRQGNKDARSMSGLDSILIGSSGILSALPGISRVGTVISICSARGADRQHALNWALLLSIPALLLLCMYDIVSVFTGSLGVITFMQLLGWFLSAIGAFCGSYLSITVMRYLTVRVGYSGFAYYSWGAALFAFILYLIT